MELAKLPRYTDFMRPTLEVLAQLGGSSSIHEIDDAVVNLMGLSDEARKLNMIVARGQSFLIAFLGQDRISKLLATLHQEGVASGYLQRTDAKLFRFLKAT